jgi:hypothetical protein
MLVLFGCVLLGSIFSTSMSWKSDVTALWPTIIEVVNLTDVHGGPEPANFSLNIANEAIRKWNEFIHSSNRSVDSVNDLFYRYQLRLFDRQHRKGNTGVKLDSHVNVTWPELEALPEYQRLRRYIEHFGLRYLNRLGYSNTSDLNIFSWAAVHSHADFHGPHTHTGELLVGVYYAQVTGGSGRLRLFDPRGQIVPFGKTYDFDCQSGQMIFFPVCYNFFVQSILI